VKPSAGAAPGCRPTSAHRNNMEDTSAPPTKRVRINEGGGDKTEPDDGNGTDMPFSQEFLTPPTAATISESSSRSPAAAEAVLTHVNLGGAAAVEGSPNAASTGASPAKNVFYTPRGGSDRTTSHNCDSGRSPAGPMTRDEIRTLLRSEAGYDVDDPNNVRKREGYLTWDDYFMAVASLSSQRSKDPHSQVGACIVDEDNRIVGIGYNGFPRGCSDYCLPWAANVTNASSGKQQKSESTACSRSEEKKADDESSPSPPAALPALHTRDPFMCHAEVNAILNKCSADIAGSRMYVARFPNNECAKVIIQSRIREVVYLEDGPDSDMDTYRASRILFEMAGVRTRKYKATRSSVTIDFGPLVDDEDVPSSSSSQMSNITKGDMVAAEQAKYRDLLLSEANYDPTQPSAADQKRAGYLSWDTYFMAVSFLSAQRSKDPNTQVGACIVDSSKCIVGIGYNGFPRGCSDDCLPWSRRAADSDLHNKYCYVTHAEVNAILNKCSADVRGATLYVALFPCNDCAKVIIQSGIREVVYLNDQYHDTVACRASRIMFAMAGVQTRQYRPESRTIVVDMMGS